MREQEQYAIARGSRVELQHHGRDLGWQEVVAKARDVEVGWLEIQEEGMIRKTGWDETLIHCFDSEVLCGESCVVGTV